MARNHKIQIRRDTAANWTSADPTLAAGELGLETDTGRMKAGDGSTAWSALDPINSGTYASAPPARKTGAWTFAPRPGLTGTSSLTQNRMYAILLEFGAGEAFDRIGVDVTTAVASATVRLGIYEVGSDGAPGALVVDAGTVDASTTGYKAVTIAQTLSGPIYVSCVLQGASGVAIRGSDSTSMMATTGGQSTVEGALNMASWIQNSVSGALPDPMAATATSGQFPDLRLRAA